MVAPYNPFLLNIAENQRARNQQTIENAISRKQKAQAQQQQQANYIQEQAIAKQEQDRILTARLARGIINAPADQKNKIYQQSLEMAKQRGINTDGMQLEYTKDADVMLQQLSALSPDTGATTTAPSDVRSFKFVKGLEADDRELFMATKRGLDIQDLGGEKVIIDPTTGNISKTFEKGLTPAEEQARKLAREKKLGSELLTESPTGEIIPEAGSPEAYKREQQQIKIEKEEVGKKKWASDMQIAGATVVRDADRIFELIGDSKPLERVALAKLPGTESNAILARIDSMKSNVGLDKLVKIKQSGAGLGQVPQSQLDLLSNTLGAFNIGQKNEDLKETVKRIQVIYDATAQNRRITKEESESIGLKLPDSFFDVKPTNQSAIDLWESL